MFFDKPVIEMNKEDIEYLVNESVRENQSLEYKKEMYGRSDEDVRELLRDITSIANAYGGRIIIGIEENDEGVAININEIEDAEDECQRILNICVSCIDPRIQGLVVWPIKINSNYVIVIEIPKNINAPHMITFRGLFQFWIRHDRSKSKMSTEEIRAIVMRSYQFQESAEKIINNQLKKAKINANNNVAIFTSTIPIIYKDSNFNLFDREIKELIGNPPNQRINGWNCGFRALVFPSLEGIVKCLDNKERILTLFRNGYMEFSAIIKRIARINRNSDNYIAIQTLPIIEFVVSFLRLSSIIYKKLGIFGPYLFSAALFNIKNSFLVENIRSVDVTDIPLSIAHINESDDVIIKPYLCSNLAEVDSLAKALIDRIWNSYGWEENNRYFSNGIFEAPGG